MKYVYFILFLNYLSVYSQNIIFTYDVNGNRLQKKINGNAPIASIVGDTVACAGDIITLSAQGGDVYQWSTGATQPSISVVASGTRQYKVIAYNNLGCKDSAIITIKSVPIPTTSIITGDSAVNRNSIKTYSVANHIGSFYDWTVTNGIIINGYGTSTITVQWTTPQNQGTVTVFEQVTSTCKSNTVSKNVIINTVTSVINNTNEFYKIYPNPSNNGVYLYFTQSNILAKYIQIFDSKGNLINNIQNVAISGDNYYLQQNLFPFSGEYLIVVETEKNAFTNKITIIK